MVNRYGSRPKTTRTVKSLKDIIINITYVLSTFCFPNTFLMLCCLSNCSLYSVSYRSSEQLMELEQKKNHTFVSMKHSKVRITGRERMACRWISDNVVNIDNKVIGLLTSETVISFSGNRCHWGGGTDKEKAESDREGWGRRR